MWQKYFENFNVMLVKSVQKPDNTLNQHKLAQLLLKNRQNFIGGLMVYLY